MLQELATIVHNVLGSPGVPKPTSKVLSFIFITYDSDFADVHESMVNSEPVLQLIV